MTRLRNMEIPKLEHAQIKRCCFAMPIQMSNTDTRPVDEVTKDTGLGPVGGHHFPVEPGSDVDHESQAPRWILCPFDSLCASHPQILESVKHLVASFVADQQISAI